MKLYSVDLRKKGLYKCILESCAKTFCDIGLLTWVVPTSVHSEYKSCYLPTSRFWDEIPHSVASPTQQTKQEIDEQDLVPLQQNKKRKQVNKKEIRATETLVANGISKWRISIDGVELIVGIKEITTYDADTIQMILQAITELEASDTKIREDNDESENLVNKCIIVLD